ncbi:hypothetical protein GCM10009596_05250 [Arthrobacter rhombi]
MAHAGSMFTTIEMDDRQVLFKVQQCRFQAHPSTAPISAHEQGTTQTAFINRCTQFRCRSRAGQATFASGGSKPDFSHRRPMLPCHFIQMLHFPYRPQFGY